MRQNHHFPTWQEKRQCKIRTVPRSRQLLALGARSQGSARQTAGVQRDLQRGRVGKEERLVLLAQWGSRRDLK